MVISAQVNSNHQNQQDKRNEVKGFTHGVTINDALRYILPSQNQSKALIAPKTIFIAGDATYFYVVVLVVFGLNQ